MHAIRIAVALFLLLTAAGSAPGGADVAEVYRQACAACHGEDGSGLAPDSPPWQQVPLATGTWHL